MIDKRQLLKDLNNDMIFEEDLVIKLADFYNTLNWRQAIDKQHHASLETGLMTLKDDSKKHANIIKDIIQYIEGSGKDGF